MCRSDVAEPASAALAQLLADMRDALCALDGSDPDDVVIGPVDFGQDGGGGITAVPAEGPAPEDHNRGEHAMTTTREYIGVCDLGHRSYLRLTLVTTEGVVGRCTTCDGDAQLSELSPPGQPSWVLRARSEGWA